ncbi:hypothetical protein RFI_12470 [Reticulomyxa filosa]|uniref:Uncharacterized protein n=1 Tax=Reticulomyxa filosa TaxID=46433 RepID=X6NED0_RETFI|nr:hypothetical protein RFI_12470 [Reticulomyxa filosa]|eukprot:ETO24685.1 hypothetical protein RFI_12470 [Reticulomyxa filosa]
MRYLWCLLQLLLVQNVFGEAFKTKAVECKDQQECENQVLTCDSTKICELTCSSYYSCHNLYYRVINPTVEQVIIRLTGKSSGEGMTVDLWEEAESERIIYILSNNSSAAKALRILGQRNDRIKVQCLEQNTTAKVIDVISNVVVYLGITQPVKLSLFVCIEYKYIFVKKKKKITCFCWRDLRIKFYYKKKK